jgi:hypothetical protein
MQQCNSRSQWAWVTLLHSLSCTIAFKIKMKKTLIFNALIFFLKSNKMNSVADSELHF